MLPRSGANPVDRPVLVEAAVETADAAVAAEKAGASRIELCGRLEIGGTTPVLSVIEETLSRVAIPVHVMVRPRGGDFTYNEDEISLMKKDVELIRSRRPAGIVLGLTGRGGQLQMSHLLKLLSAANGLPVTFHRAFDALLHPHAALEDLVDLRVARVLTSGGDVSAFAGAGNIAALVRQARNRITVIAAGGVRAHNARELVQRAGVHEVHARFVDDAQMRALVDAVRS
jgi:copper homeostasis protein